MSNEDIPEIVLIFESLIQGLADQQAMGDDWYKPQAKVISDFLRKVATYPQIEGIAAKKLDSILSRGWKVAGVAVAKGPYEYGFVTTGGFVGWWLPEQYANHTSGEAPPAIT